MDRWWCAGEIDLVEATGLPRQRRAVYEYAPRPSKRVTGHPEPLGREWPTKTLGRAARFLGSTQGNLRHAPDGGGVPT